MTPIVSKYAWSYCNNKDISINKNIQHSMEAAIFDTGNLNL